MTTIREVRPSDFQDLINNYYSYYDELKENPDLGLGFFNSKPPMAEELDWISKFYKGLDEGNVIATVAEIDSKVVGMCEVSRLHPNSEVSHRGELGIAIVKEHRGKGIGTTLIEKTLEKCKGKFEIVELSVFSSNQRAKKLYEKFGFEVIGSHSRAVKRGDVYHDDYLMSLRLS